jgi:3-dehydroquinate dehydratase/shikimate dehydrogenase
MWNGAAQRTCAIVATLTPAAWKGSGDLRALRGKVNGLEIRADLTNRPDLDMLRGSWNVELIYCLRSAEYGGAFVGDDAERRRRLLAAARSYDVVELELDRDLSPELLAAVPPHRRRICWHGKGLDLAELSAIFARMVNTQASLYVLAPQAETVEQAMTPLRWLGQLNRSDVTAFATGNLGACSRLLAPWFGAPVVFGGLGRDDASGAPSVERLVNAYPFPDLPPLEQVFGIVGRPRRETDSPRLHNDAYRVLGLPALYVPMPVHEFSGAWRAMCSCLEELGLTFGGATVAAPFKEEALRLADTATGEASCSGAANLLVRDTDGWRAHTTDPVGVVGALRRAGVKLAGRETAVVGCGGAGRGAAAGLLAAGAIPTIVNRGQERGLYAADLLGIDYLPLAQFAPEKYSLIVHATPVRGVPPFAVDRVADDAAVVDLAYGAQETGLAAAMRAHLGVFVDGRRVLEVEAEQQFQLLTGRSMPGASESSGVTGFPAQPAEEGVC